MVWPIVMGKYGPGPRLAQREAARASWLSERQHVVQGRLAPSGAFGDQPRCSQGRAANSVLHYSRQHAPPPTRPGIGSGISEGRRRTESPDPDELSDKRLRDEEALAAAALQFRMRCTLAAWAAFVCRCSGPACPVPWRPACRAASRS
eukprot:s1128_g2.t1